MGKSDGRKERNILYQLVSPIVIFILKVNLFNYKIFVLRFCIDMFHIPSLQQFRLKYLISYLNFLQRITQNEISWSSYFKLKWLFLLLLLLLFCYCNMRLPATIWLLSTLFLNHHHHHHAFVDEEKKIAECNAGHI